MTENLNKDNQEIKNQLENGKKVNIPIVDQFNFKHFGYIVKDGYISELELQSSDLKENHAITGDLTNLNFLRLNKCNIKTLSS